MINKNYKCEMCNYTARYPKDLNKHLMTDKHLKKILLLKNNELDIHPVKMFICDNCNVQFANRHSLFKHKKNQVCIKKETINNDIKTQNKSKLDNEELLFDFIKKQEDELKITRNMLLEVIKNIKPQNINKGSINIQYIIQNYKDAPVIKALTNEEIKQIEHKPDDKLIDCIIYHQNHKTLHMYIGDILIEHYKKEDPKQQSLWSSDSSRLHYIVMMELRNNKDWIRDKDGMIVIKELIRPILQFIKNEIKEYYKKTFEDASNKDLVLISEKKYQLSFVVVDIDDKHLEQRILKYISPKFSPSGCIQANADDNIDELFSDDHDQSDNN